VAFASCLIASYKRCTMEEGGIWKGGGWGAEFDYSIIYCSEGEINERYEFRRNYTITAHPERRTQGPQSSYPVCPTYPANRLPTVVGSPKNGVLSQIVCPCAKRRNVGPGHTPATCRMAPIGTNRAPTATAKPNSFPGGVVADSSGVIDPSAPVSIRSKPLGGVWGGVVAYSTVMTLGATDDPRGR